MSKEKLQKVKAVKAVKARVDRCTAIQVYHGFDNDKVEVYHNNDNIITAKINS